MRRYTVLGASLLVFLGVIAFGHAYLPAVAQVGTPAAPGRGLVGAWRVTVKPTGQASFANLSVYNADGTLVTSGPPVEPAPPGAPFKQIFSSAGHGVWQVTGPTTAAVTVVILESDEAGHFLGSVTVRGTNQLSADGQHFSGAYVATIADPTGKVVQTSPGTVQATRITVQPLGTPAAGTPTT